MNTLDILESLLRVLKIEMYHCNDKGDVDTESLIEIMRITEQMRRVAKIELEKREY